VFILLTTVSRSEQVQSSSQPNTLTYLRSILALSFQFAIDIADGRRGAQTSVLSHVSELSTANIPLLPCRVATISCSRQSQGYARPTVSRPVGQSVLVSDTHLGVMNRFVLPPSVTRGHVCSLVSAVRAQQDYDSVPGSLYTVFGTDSSFSVACALCSVMAVVWSRVHEYVA
jgi:hypothetical protein